MPGAMTHYIFYNRLKECLRIQGAEISDRYDDFSNFAQGHDLLIFQNYMKSAINGSLDECIAVSKKLQEYSFIDFVYEYLKNAEKKHLLKDDSVRYFICHGYISHHILDSYTHPLIIYYSGDHVRTKETIRWEHGIAENLIDAYLIEQEYGIKAAKYPVHKLFRFDKSLFTDELRCLLSETTKIVYGYDGAGKWFEEGCRMLRIYMRRLKYDPTGIRRFLLDIIEHFAHGANASSYNRDISEVNRYINNDHELWMNPMNPNITSTASFMDLFEQALEHTTDIVINLEKLMDRGNIHREDVAAILPDIASTHAQACGQDMMIRVKKEWH